jgi:hypothetical protein
MAARDDPRVVSAVASRRFDVRDGMSELGLQQTAIDNKRSSVADCS